MVPFRRVSLLTHHRVNHLANPLTALVLNQRLFLHMNLQVPPLDTLLEGPQVSRLDVPAVSRRVIPVNLRVVNHQATLRVFLACSPLGSHLVDLLVDRVVNLLRFRLEARVLPRVYNHQVVPVLGRLVALQYLQVAILALNLHQCPLLSRHLDQVETHHHSHRLDRLHSHLHSHH